MAMVRGLPDGPVPPTTYMLDFDVDVLFRFICLFKQFVFILLFSDPFDLCGSTFSCASDGASESSPR
eukprot:12158060-Heterocapsa_arctica.AAC.1